MGGEPVMRPVLIVGAPRSGTSWVFRSVGRAENTLRIYEPDNETLHPRALMAKRGLGRFPVLGPHDSSPEFQVLWERAMTGRLPSTSRPQRWAESLFEGAPPGARKEAIDGGSMSARIRVATLLSSLPDRTRSPAGAVPVVKSVHSAFSLGWLTAHWDPRVVIVQRDPRNVIASWLDMDIGDRDRRLDDDLRVRSSVIEPLGLPPSPSSEEPIRRVAWNLGVLQSAMASAAREHPDRVIVSHEELCVDPRAGFRALVSTLGLTWTDACDRYLERANAQGEGYAVKRVAADLPERWRERLGPEQAAEITDELARFPDVRPDPKSLPIGERS
jgi:hypothetical protein